MSAPTPRDGPTDIDGFKILGLLDEGSMALVYHAQGPDGAHYALKTFYITSDMTEAERKLLFEAIRREGTILQRLKHPNIVKVKTARADEDSQQAYIVMELVEGGTVAKAVERGVPDFQTVIGWIRQVASALDYFHQYSVHRDVKPSNMLLSTSGLDVKLADFGIAKSSSGLSTSMNSTLFPHGKPGTPFYRSPEQILQPRDVDGKADQWGLAVSAYYMLTGKLPFEGDDTDQVNQKIIQRKQDPPSSKNRSLPKAVDRVFERALAKTPPKRYPTCSEFAEALAAALEGRASSGVLIKVAILGLCLVALLAAGVGGYRFFNQTAAPGPNPIPVDPKPDGLIVVPCDLSPDKKGCEEAGRGRGNPGGDGRGDRKPIIPPAPPPKPPEPQPPAPSACKPRYKLLVELMEKAPTGGERWTDVTAIRDGAFSKYDPRYGYLGRGDLRARISAVGCPISSLRDSLAVAWKLDDDPATNVPAKPDAGGNILVPYNDPILKARYKVELLVNKDSVDAVSFTIKD